MPRSLYFSRLSDDVVRTLYREGRRRRIPRRVWPTTGCGTRSAASLIIPPALLLREEEPVASTTGAMASLTDGLSPA